MDLKKKKIITTVLWIIIIAYFALPPHNKIAQWGYLASNIVHYMETNPAKLAKTDYIFHRNNAIYLSRMNNKTGALREMNRAIDTLPLPAPEGELYTLYKERAIIKVYYGEYKSALSDYLRVPDMDMMDMLRVAMLFKQQGKRKYAVSYCNKILDRDIRAYAGYACVADVYADAGKYEVSVAMMDLLIDRVPHKPRSHQDRAYYKKLNGDIKGYEDDMKKVEELTPGGFVKERVSLTEEIIHPKYLNLTIL